MKDEWILPEAKDHNYIDTLSNKTGINKNIISILVNRGFNNEEEITQFIYPELNALHSPFLLKGISEAILRLKNAISKGEKIAIFGDSDLDGITSLTIIHNILIKFGSIPLIRYPKAKESYGLTREIINEFILNKVTLVITVDSGIRDIDEVFYGKENGIDFIITDHHEPDILLPVAIIINPKQNECIYPFKELAGVGVAFKFIQAFLYSYTSAFNRNFFLVYAKDGSYCIKKIKNGIIENESTCDKKNIHIFISDKVSVNDYIVLSNAESFELATIIKNNNFKINITDIKKIACHINSNDFDSRAVIDEQFFKDLNINKKILQNEFELYTKLFIEIQWKNSNKITTVLNENFVLATIGTIADIMPLYGENRYIVKTGISLINNGVGHRGILSLTNNSATTSKSISWDIAPLLNAPGRMGETDMTVNFFLEQDVSIISELIISIERINKSRKKLVLEIIEKIKNESSESIFNENIFFYMHEDILDGLAGLIANRLADDLKKPVIIGTGIDENGLVKGSARSSGEFDFFKFTSSISHLFERIGGHAQAFGFTAEKNNLKKIIYSLNELIGNHFIPESFIQIDSIINVSDINSEFIDSMSLLEPYGKNNEEPIFLVRGIHIDSFNSFGNQENHGKYIIYKNIHAIGWNQYTKMDNYYKSKKPLDIVFKMEKNEYKGKIYPRMIILDLDYTD